jgi:hypothetical protein
MSGLLLCGVWLGEPQRKLNTMNKIFIFLLFLFNFLSKFSSQDSCSYGSYRSLKSPWKNGCPGYRLCEKGFYCLNERKEPCPGGTYGNQDGLTSSNCSNYCPGGFYCPKQTINPLKCQQTVTDTDTNTDTVTDTITTITTTVLPQISTSILSSSSSSSLSMNSNLPPPPPPLNNHERSLVYCPPGSSSPLLIPSGYYSQNSITILLCPYGYYCHSGYLRSCSAGSYGNQLGLSSPSCSGQCPSGFFCSTATSDPFSSSCPHEPTHFCPIGSKNPIAITLGYYAIKEEDEDTMTTLSSSSSSSWE